MKGCHLQVQSARRPLTLRTRVLVLDAMKFTISAYLLKTFEKLDRLTDLLTDCAND